ncbi:unnamed protein product [Agarophyton chilense]
MQNFSGSPLSAPENANAIRVRVVLNPNSNQNSLELIHLLHTLSGTNPNSIAPILDGLAHHTVSLHMHNQMSPLHQLTRAALNIDLHALTQTNGSQHIALDTFVSFLINLVSANANYIESVFGMIFKRAFTISAANEELLKAMHRVISYTLQTYPRSKILLLSILQSSYPHPIRPPVEHLSYSRAALRLAYTTGLSHPLLLTFTERLAAIEALVPQNVYADDSSQLCLEAERLELVLLEFCSFFDKGGSFEAAFTAYQVFIVPLDCPRYTPYCLIYAACINPSITAVHEVVERLWQSFHEPSTPFELRRHFLEHSASVVLRTKTYDSDSVIKWITRLAAWMNAYIDALNGNEYLDVDLHSPFYTAVSVLMKIMIGRRIASINHEVLSTMRLYRILCSGLSVATVLPHILVKKFMDEVLDSFDLDCTHVIQGSRHGFLSGATQRETKNTYNYNDFCPNVMLPKFKAKLNQYIIWYEDAAETDHS